jgi:hypothetical protein
MCSLSTFLFHMDSTSSFFLIVFFGKFQHESYANMWGHYGSMIMGFLLRPFNEASSSTTNIFWWYKPSFLCAPSAFLRCWALVTLYFCCKFCIFNRLGLEEYVSQVERGPHLFQSCLYVAQDGLFIAREMHLFFENLVVIDTPSV